MGYLTEPDITTAIGVSVTLFLVAAAGTILLRRWLAGPHVLEADPRACPPEVVACLVGGRRNMADTVLASLLASGALAVDRSAPPYLRVTGPLAADATPAEHAAYTLAPGRDIASVRKVLRQGTESAHVAVDAIERGLLAARGSRLRTGLLTMMVWVAGAALFSVPHGRCVGEVANRDGHAGCPRPVRRGGAGGRGADDASGRP